MKGTGKAEQLMKHHEETLWMSQWNQTNIPVGVQVTDKHENQRDRRREETRYI